MAKRQHRSAVMSQFHAGHYLDSAVTEYPQMIRGNDVVVPVILLYSAEDFKSRTYWKVLLSLEVVPLTL